MKKYLSLLPLLFALTANAQWSNTTNQFFDSLHMTVTQVVNDQSAPLVVQSFPDSGYFVIWQDSRNYAVSKGDIYAQKYDKNGVRLWAENGIPVTTGPNNQYYVYNSNEDYRNRSFAATDSAGGFYVCYTDDSVSNYSWPRAAVQHVRSNGSAVFSGAGYIIGQVPSDGSYVWGAPQLIADGVGGFYMSFVKQPYNTVLYVFNGKEENNTMQILSSNIVNNNAIQKSEIGPCGIRMYVEYPTAGVNEYNIWPDGQGGCNIVMYLSANGIQGTMLGYNRIWRAKKDALTRKYRRNETGAPCLYVDTIKKGSTYLMYRLEVRSITTACYTLTTPPVVYVVTSYFLIANGFAVVDNGAYAYDYPKGVTTQAAADINVTMLAATQRKLTGNSVSNFFVQGYAFKQEIFDSIPYQIASSNDPDGGYGEDPTLTKFSSFRDTLIASGNYYPDFSLSAGGGNFYAASLMSLSGSRDVRLQRLHINSSRADSLYLEYDAAKAGNVIGREVYTGFSGSGISYDFPLIRVANNGDAIFSILENGRFTRISPIWSGTRLHWGAMGRPAGTGIYKYGYYGNDQPFLTVDATGRSGVLAWHDNRFQNTNSNGTDILMRHIDRLDDILYSPPRRPVRLLPNPYGPTPANPAVLMGTSNAYTPFEVSSIYYEPSTTTIAEIVDKQNLGVVNMSVYQNTGTIRRYNGAAYLDRNLLVVTENTPPTVPMQMRIYFTKTEFDALKATEALLQNPGDLAIIAQPPTADAPQTYAPVAGEKTYTPSAWDSLPGGYYIEFTTTGFGNFFITRSTPTVLCPGGNTNLTSNISGSSYVWQVDMGSGFVFATNSTNISGVNTPTLQLTNIPSSWYGYKFRCLVDLVPGNTFTLQFLANWVGGTSTNWNNPANWGCGAVPDANTDVMITSGNVVVNTNSSCRTLTVKPGASVTVKPGVNLDVMK